jgi:large subunit ribosomal protein L25
MKTTEIIGFKRANLGKKASKDLRFEANVPCVLYGGEDQVHFHTPMILFRDLVYTSEACIVALNIEGTTYKCILQDVQFHPVNDIILHADFLLVTEDKPVKIDVPVRIIGVSPGVQLGGKLVHKQKKVRVKALVKDLPDYVEANINSLELGKSLRVRELAVGNYEILNAPSVTVCSIEIPRALRGKQQG